MNKSLFIIVAVVSAVILYSCAAKPEVYTADVNPLAWDKGSSVVVTVDNDDTISRRSIFIVLRYVLDTGGKDMGFILSTVTPGGAVWSDTIIMHRGAGMQVSTDIWENEMQYRSDVVLGERGLYRFHFQPVAEILGMYAVGLHFKK